MKRLQYRARVRQDLKTCDDLYLRQHGRHYPEAVQALEELRRDPRDMEHEMVGRGALLATLSLALLLVLWIAFLTHVRGVDRTMVISMTPLLIALSLVASVLPVVSRLKVAGFEAEMRQAQPNVGEVVQQRLDFGRVATVVSARQTLRDELLEPREHLPELMASYLPPAHSVTTSSMTRKEPSELSKILRDARTRQ